MTEREKLIDIIKRAEYEETFCNSDGEPVTTIKRRVVKEEMVEAFADYLIKNGTLTAPYTNQLWGAAEALADMVGQFGSITTFRRQEALRDRGLSALENAFGALQDCGCRLNSNGTITLKNLWKFQEEAQRRRDGE